MVMGSFLSFAGQGHNGSYDGRLDALMQMINGSEPVNARRALVDLGIIHIHKVSLDFEGLPDSSCFIHGIRTKRLSAE